MTGPTYALPGTTIDPVTQHHQVKPHQGFKPEYHARRKAPRMIAGSGAPEPTFARPPEWTIDAECHGLWHTFDKPDYEHKPLCARICDGCPVKDLCLQDALVNEAGVSGYERATYRAGTTSWDRVRLHLAMEACPGCGDTVSPRSKHTGSCTTCTRRATLERRADMEAVA